MDVTLNDYIATWNEQRKGSVTESTRASALLALEPVRELVGDWKLEELNRPAVIQLQKELYEGKGGKKRPHASSVNYRITTLSTVLKSAMLDGLIPSNPCRNVKALRCNEPKAADTIHRALTADELEIFFRFYSGWYRNLFHFLLDTGMRIGEACALQWSDVDDGAAEIHVHRTTEMVQHGKIIIVNHCKTRTSVRDIPVNTRVSGDLEAQEELLRQKQNSRKTPPPSGLVFPGRDGVSTSNPHTPNELIHLAVGKANRNGFAMEPFSVHAFRDTFATNAVRAGVDFNTLKALLGHSSLAMTMDLYAHVLPDTKAAAMRLIEEY